MRVCTSCGSTNEPYAACCVVCGGSLEGAAETRSPAQLALNRTALGLPSPAQQAGISGPGSEVPSSSVAGIAGLGTVPQVHAESEPAAPGAERGLGGTQILLPVATAQVAAAQAAGAPGQAARSDLLRTQLQYAAPQPAALDDLGAPTTTKDALTPGAAAPNTAPPDTTPDAAGPAAAAPGLSKVTMLGMPAAQFAQVSARHQQAAHIAQAHIAQAHAEQAHSQQTHPQAAPPQDARHKQTLLGLPPAALGVKSTMLGIAPAQPLAPAPDQASHADDPPSSFASAAALRPALASDKRTMLGVAMPGIAPTGAGAGPVESQKRTMLGVAMPGIAPINPGVAPASAAAHNAAAHNAAAHDPAPELIAQQLGAAPPAAALYQGAGFAHAPSDASRAKRSLLPWFLMATALVILVGGAALWLLVRPSTPISARLQATESGKEQLELSCLACPDATQIRLKSQSGAAASFSAGRANLSLESSLSVGDNQVELELTRPGAQPEPVQLNIPVDYRVHIDLTALDATPPALALAVEARPGSKVQVEGKPLELDADGKGTWTQDLSALLVGEAKGVERLERELSYEVSPPGGNAQSGTAKLRIGIAPLVVEAPLSKLTVDKARFLLSGSTQADVDVSVSDRAIKRAADGKFSQVMSVSTLGETTVFVKASKQGYAPRRVPLRIKRVANLEQASVEFKKQSLKSYREANAALGKSAGSRVAWAGRVTDLREADGRSVILLDVSGQCAAPPCLARVVYAGESKPKTGNQITVYGEITRAVAGPRSGQQVPEVHAEFLTEGGT